MNEERIRLEEDLETLQEVIEVLGRVSSPTMDGIGGALYDLIDEMIEDIIKSANKSEVNNAE